MLRLAPIAIAIAIAIAAFAARASAAPATAADRNSDGSSRALPPGPPDEPGRTLTLDYDDFGPQGEAYELIGYDRWSWGECACYERDDSFDIRVVVYRGVSRAQVARRYPVVKAVSDYRYVERDRAIAYLTDHIHDLQGEVDLVDVTLRLIDTRAHIAAALGDRGRPARAAGPRSGQGATLR